jgi:hypothetical protein
VDDGVLAGPGAEDENRLGHAGNPTRSGR